MSPCSVCYELSIVECADIVLEGLEADTDYEVTITDKFGAAHIFEATSDADGEITIVTNPLSEDFEDLGLPEFYFNKNAGMFTITTEKFVSLYEKEPVVFNIDDVDYDCVLLSVVDSYLSIDTSAPVDMRNILVGTTFDMFIENTIVGNTDLINKIGALGNTRLASDTGAILQWVHRKVSGGDQWNAIEQDAIYQGKNFQTEQQGDLYNGGVPYGHDFFVDDFLHLIQQLPVMPRCITGVNIIIPLIPYSSALIDWVNMDLQALIDEIAIMIAHIYGAGSTIEIVEVGMELRTNQYNTVLANPGGVENTKGKILKKLMTHTNASSSISISDYIRQQLPNVIISMDNKLWDDLAAAQGDFNTQVMSIPQVDVGRQYFQLADANATSYAVTRAYLQTGRTAFWAYVEGPNFLGKGVFISQFTLKQNSPLRNTVANGLIVAEGYMLFSEDNLVHSNKLVGVVQQAMKHVFDVGDNYSLRPQYPFIKMLGAFYADDQQLVSATINDADADTDLLRQAIITGDEIKVQIINPTATERTLTSLRVDGVVRSASEFTMTQQYSDDTTNPETEPSTEVIGTELRFRPYSMSILVANR